MWHVSRQLGWFGVGGFIGFVVDAGIVQLLVSKLNADPYVGRLFSFTCAATATWLFNRRFTFHQRGDYTLFGEWSRYLVAMSAGFALNYTTYALVVYFSHFVQDWPSIGVAVGSLPGSAVNFLGARHWVFAGDRKGGSPRPGQKPDDQP
ncbi:MAG TPA: GtrA family protein [Rhodanobacteraceae bacterium]|jgi:putative flippase GtrA|nr:GtrA family protein [Rhodanobacteraceae bacterium]